MGDRDQLKNLEERNANLERDVRRYEERRQIERDVRPEPCLHWTRADLIS